MSRHGIPIGRIFGISIDLDLSWFLIVGLLTWSLAVSYFPAQFPGWPASEYWALGFISAILLFASVLVHELAHSVVAGHFGLFVPRITLFLFGGVSQLATEPPSAAAEFWISVVGPLTSFALAAFFWELEPLLAASQPLIALASYLALLNLVLAVFNLIPGFPLDGGRIFRAAVWRFTNSYHQATVSAGISGRFFGFLLIFYGVWRALTGNIIDGVWIAIIGWFLESAAGSQLQQETLRRLLGGHKVADAMQRNFPVCGGEDSIEHLAVGILQPLRSRFAIVTENGVLTGIVTMAAIREIPREKWPATTVAQIMIPLQRMANIEPNAPLWSALEKMGRDGVNQLPVLQAGGVVGVLSRDDIVHYLGEVQTLSA
ncbi:MAG TPA: site-2 protease family protein [Acidobacteriaceae bacterium]|nr:site-2 protease family protein [Acidobacteriaceae bacterium]